MSSHQTPDASFEGRDSPKDDHDEHVDLMMIHEKKLTNMEKFFDEPVWIKVLGKLKKMTVIESCFSASPFFGDLLRDKREREVVLPTVFGILSKRYCNEKNKDESYKETNLESIPWQRPAQRPRSHRMTSIWKCRLVCKKWNEGIEAIHRNETAGHYLMGDDFDSHAENKQFGRKWGTDIFFYEAKVVKFLDHFEATHFAAVGREGRAFKKCPFLGRTVEVRYDRVCLVNKQVYFSKLTELFGKFGDQVWNVKFHWKSGSEEGELVDFYLKVKRMVELMPNLKVLRISYSGDEFSQKEEQALEEEILSSPFPELTHLKMISVEEIPGVFVNHLVNQNRQITTLDIGEIEFNGNCAVFKEKLPNLTQLGLIINSLEYLEEFERYPALLNLEKLHFQLHFPFEQFVRWSRIFNAIGTKVNSDLCTHLLILMPAPIDDHDEKNIQLVLEDSLRCRLQLENIQRCKVDSCSRFSLDFLLPSKNSLRELRVEMICEKPEWREEQVIKFVGYEDKMEYSNIAKELPRLRKLEIEIYTDYEYELSRHYSIQPNGVVQVESVDVRKKEV